MQPVGSLQFIGTATVLIKCGEFTILTDPNFLHRYETVYLGYGVRSMRLSSPALELADVPPLDFVLLSHLHEDHFDSKVEAALDKMMPIITTPKAARALGRRGFQQAEGLTTWQFKRLTKGDTALTISAVPGRHGPGLVNKLLPDVMGSVLDFRLPGDQHYRMYITGDTLMFDDIELIPKRFPGIDLAILHLGGTRIFGLKLTMDATQGVRMLQVLQPHAAIPVHYNDYEVFKSPLSDFQKAATAAGFQPVMHYLSPGDTYELTTGGFS